MKIPKTRGGLTAYILAVFIMTFSIFLTPQKKTFRRALAPSPSPSPLTVLGATKENDFELAQVTGVTDGDTIKTDLGKIRLIGVDAPEIGKNRGCMGQEAREYIAKLLGNSEVKLEKDKSETDKYGRLLRYIYLGDTFVNLDLVKKGFAYARDYPPDSKYKVSLQTAEREAIKNDLGVWSKKCIGN